MEQPLLYILVSNFAETVETSPLWFIQLGEPSFCCAGIEGSWSTGPYTDSVPLATDTFSGHSQLIAVMKNNYVTDPCIYDLLKDLKA